MAIEVHLWGRRRRRRKKKRSDAQKIIIYRVNRVTTVRKHMEVTQLQSLLMFSIQLDVWRGF